MVITKEITVWCDFDECDNWTQYNDFEARGLPSLARRLARRDGWTHSGGKDLCRKHSARKPA